MENIKHRLVNWQESMGVEFGHFRQTENYFIDRLADNMASRLTGYNYGLLPAADRKSSSSSFEIAGRVTGGIVVRLRSCNAVTIGGFRIAYNPTHSGYIEYTHLFDESSLDKSETKYWDVVLSLDPFNRLPEGEPSEKENLIRHPDVVEEYKLSIAAPGEIKYEQLGKYHLIIGRIRQQGEHCEVDTNFIPPCTSMSSHPDLLHYYENFGVYLNNIEQASKAIITKIRNRSQNSPLAIHIGNLCEDVMRYIASVFFSYRNMGRDMAPVEIVNYFSTLAHTFYINLEFIGKMEKEELMKYFYEWSDVTPGTMEELLAGTLNIRYNHHSIRPVMLQVESFIRILSELWVKLSSLEYIGQHKENIVISERSYGQDTKKKESGGWTILD